MGGAFRRLSVVVEKLLHHDFIGDSARLQNIEGFPLKKAVSLRAHRGTAFVTVAYRRYLPAPDIAAVIIYLARLVSKEKAGAVFPVCLLYTSDAADD